MQSIDPLRVAASLGELWSPRVVAEVDDVRLDTQEEVEYWRHGGIMPRVWRGHMER